MKILLLAGEESGLLYADRLRAALPADCEYRTYATEGFHTADLAVMGFLPVLKRLPFFLRVARTMKAVIRGWRPDVVVTVDYPGLNLKLAAYAKALGIPAVHIVCPQVWAWHRGRVPKVAAALTKLLCFFPFEPSIFEGTGLDAKFIGHPLADIVSAEAHPPRRKGLVALLPGSRMGEIHRNLPRLLAAARLLAADVPGLSFEIPAASSRARAAIDALLAATPDLPPVIVRDGGARALLAAADCATVASGTATLEAALARCPTALVYAVSASFAWFCRHFVTGVKHIGLANIIWDKCGGTGEAPMPEILQEAFTPEAVAATLKPWLADEAARAEAVARLEAACRLLVSDGDAIAHAAREVAACASK